MFSMTAISNVLIVTCYCNLLHSPDTVNWFVTCILMTICHLCLFTVADNWYLSLKPNTFNCNWQLSLFTCHCCLLSLPVTLTFCCHLSLTFHLSLIYLLPTINVTCNCHLSKSPVTRHTHPSLVTVTFHLSQSPVTVLFKLELVFIACIFKLFVHYSLNDLH